MPTARRMNRADDPVAMTAAVAGLVHQGASIDEAMAILEKNR